MNALRSAGWLNDEVSVPTVLPSLLMLFALVIDVKQQRSRLSGQSACSCSMNGTSALRGDLRCLTVYVNAALFCTFLCLLSTHI